MGPALRTAPSAPECAPEGIPVESLGYFRLFASNSASFQVSSNPNRKELEGTMAKTKRYCIEYQQADGEWTLHDILGDGDKIVGSLLAGAKKSLAAERKSDPKGKYRLVELVIE